MQGDVMLQSVGLPTEVVVAWVLPNRPASIYCFFFRELPSFLLRNTVLTPFTSA